MAVVVREHVPVQEYNCFLSDLTQDRAGTFITSSYNELNMLNLAYIITVYMSDKKGMEILQGNLSVGHEIKCLSI